MNLEIFIIYSIYINSSFSSNDSHLTEFSESFLKEEIKNIDNKNISKLPENTNSAISICKNLIGNLCLSHLEIY